MTARPFILNRNMKRGYLYFIHELGQGSVRCKIGQTVCVRQRRNALQVGNPNRLVVSAYLKVNDAIGAENFAKDFFANDHIRGEWFFLSQDHAKMFCETYPNVSIEEEEFYNCIDEKSVVINKF